MRRRCGARVAAARPGRRARRWRPATRMRPATSPRSSPARSTSACAIRRTGTPRSTTRGPKCAGGTLEPVRPAGLFPAITTGRYPAIPRWSTNCAARRLGDRLPQIPRQFRRRLVEPGLRASAWTGTTSARASCRSSNGRARAPTGSTACWQFDAYLQSDLEPMAAVEELPLRPARAGAREQRLSAPISPNYANDPSGAGVQPYGDWRGRTYSLSLTATF